MIKIKNEFLDTRIYCPGTRKEVYVRFIDKSLYQFYYNSGYSFIFDEIVEEVIEKPIKKSKNSQDDIS
jgi:hypothetical protein